ncbi:hypothetical protein FKW77_009790 [Venturia effusa]|uniref:Uncharacterized protein n=1 Tax=Venturia effusa TaxID=50376 RepID=A0A517LBQ8_9PEZI|nr:hypothetical protein FKW77_009790 [Venturia effusa]
MSAPEAIEHGLAVRDINHTAGSLRKPVSRELPNISANIGKRRALAGPLLSSPARQGHGKRMAEIYSNARAKLDDMSDTSASPRLSQSTRLSTTDSYELNYPALPLKPSAPFNLQDDPLVCKPEKNSELIFPVLNWMHNSAFGPPSRGRRRSRDAENHSLRTPSPRYCPLRPLRRKALYSTETLKPERYYADLGRPAEPPRSDTAIPEVSSETEGSSASWTGDSEFYYPKPQPLPQQQRQCSVSEWLERLPEKLDRLGHMDTATDSEKAQEKAEADEQEDEHPMSPLSPYVELQRGTIRRRRVEKQVRQRCASYDDDDIFGGEDRGPKTMTVWK